MYATDAEYLNDSQEVVYAVNLARKYFRNRTPKHLRFEMEMKNILDQTEGLVGKLPVYVASFSEEPDLLSQWRGYCSDGSGFTLCVSANHMRKLTRTHKWELFKCIYDEETQVEVLKKMHEEAAGDSSLAETFPVQVTFGLLLLYFATAFKHPKFKEESEWRAVKRMGGTPFPVPGEPMIPPNVRPGRSTLVPYIPFPLILSRSDSLEFADLVVGPTPHPRLAARAVKSFFQEKNVICPEPRISEVPFRNW